MKRFLFLYLALLLIAPRMMAEPVDYVNVLMGTDSSRDFSAGNTYPAIALPWGMNAWTPVTGKMGSGWQYTYNARKIYGFKQTHQPSPWINDYGQFEVMATCGKPVFSEDKRASWFSHKAEVATPYYYKVYLAEWDVVAEIVPTERAACFRFTFPETQQANIVVDAFDGKARVDVNAEKHEVTGFSVRNSGGVPNNFRNFFVMKLNRSFNVVETEDSKRKGAVITMATRKGEQVELRVASSFISQDQAWRNFKELEDMSFEEIKDKGRKRWNEVLGKVCIDEKENIDHLRTFYSCLYRALLFPRRFYEFNDKGMPVHYSPYNGKVLPGYMYTDTGFWDTFRALFPLLNLLYPSENMKIQEGLVNAFNESGFLPEWASPGHRDCMVGNNSASVVADAYLKLKTMLGKVDYDVQTLWKAVTHGANAVHPQVASTGRRGHDYYNQLGYVPCDVGINESAARTLEYAYDDWCIAQLGIALGNHSDEVGLYLKRSQNYRNIFSTEDRLMRGKKKNGQWRENFNPFKWGGDFTEGNAWHYTWSVFHDVNGLIGLMGGERNFSEMLDSVFRLPPIFDDSYYGHVIHEIREMQVMNMGNYAHGNQPIQHMIYLYDYAGQPQKTQFWVREVMDRFYKPVPDGYCGDEDNGQTSAWFVFSALGFYPVCPAADDYALGIPYFNEVRLLLENGNQVDIVRQGTQEQRQFKVVRCDGISLEKPFLPFSRLIKAQKVVFDNE